MKVFTRIFFLGFLLVAAACSPKSAAPLADASPVEKKVAQSPLVTKRYQLEGLDRCSTTEQIVEAPTDEELKKAYCERLKDGSANNSCAETQRLNLFVKDCPGQTWEPTESWTGITKERKTAESFLGASYPSLEHLAYLKIDKVDQVSGLTTADLLVTENVLQIFRTCGLSRDCLMQLSQAGTLSFSYFHWETEKVSALVVKPHETYQVVGLGPKPEYLDNVTPLNIVFKFKDGDISQGPTVEVWREKYSRGFRSYREFLSDPLSTQKLFSAAAILKN